MRRIVLVILAVLSVSACDTWLGGADKKPLVGKRISVLALQKQLEPDPGLAATEVRLPKPEDTEEWPQAGGYAPHAMHHLELAEDLKEAWSHNVGDGSAKRRKLLAQPVVADGRVYTMDASSTVTALDAKTGKRVWEQDVTPKDGEGGIGGGVAYDDGHIYAATGYAQVVSLDAKTGKIEWREQLSGPVRGSPTARAGRVFAVTVDNATHALAGDTGKLLWSHQGLSETATLLGGSSPAVDGNTVVVAYSSGELFALRLENGSVLWSESLNALRRTDAVSTLTDIRGLPVIDHGRVYAIGNSDLMVAIDLRTGRRLWEKELGSNQTPWLAGDYLYVLTTNSELVCVEAKSGRTRWVTPLQQWEDESEKSGRLVWSGPVLASDRLIVVSSHGWALAVSPYDGQALGKEELSEGVTISPVIANQTLYFYTNDADVVAYR